jgi:hypothetical protein
MDKEKLSNGVMWISMAFLFLFSAVTSLYVGFNKDNNLFIVLGIVFIACLFFFAYKGFSTLLDAFFKKKK